MLHVDSSGDSWAVIPFNNGVMPPPPMQSLKRPGLKVGVYFSTTCLHRPTPPPPCPTNTVSNEHLCSDLIFSGPN